MLGVIASTGLFRQFIYPVMYNAFDWAAEFPLMLTCLTAVPLLSLYSDQSATAISLARSMRYTTTGHLDS